jgi:hypothetical protein
MSIGKEGKYKEVTILCSHRKAKPSRPTANTDVFSGVLLAQWDQILDHMQPKAPLTPEIDITL